MSLRKTTTAQAVPPLPKRARTEDRLTEPRRLTGRGSVAALPQETLTKRASAMIDATADGPILSGRRAPHLPGSQHTFVRLLATRDRLAVAALTTGWLIVFLAFWAWWLRPEHRASWTGLVLNSALLLYLSLLPVGFLVVVNRLYRVNPNLQVPALRVAFVVTKAPSEPWDMASATLQAMLDQEYPYAYDVWLCDEDPTDEVRAWCEERGVRLSTRRGVADYHQPDWPRRTKCKEGNLAYFYDHWGYREYDVVAQLDCDHVPAPNYLSEVVRPFADPSIGYVAAPSMNDANADTSWSARGRLHREASFHGPFQLGHSNGLAPVCIGSHYAVRTAALQRIGGVGPELAEDFSTAFLLTSAGWRSAFVHTAEAHGDGPRTFAAMITQEFQWSRSLAMLSFQTVPKHFMRLSALLRVRFLFALSFYPLLVLVTLGGLTLSATAAASGLAWVRVGYIEFLLRYALPGLFLIAIVVLLKRRGLLRPASAPVLSWENWMYALTRWVFVTWGVVAALRQRIRPTQVAFKVTPKSVGGLEPFPMRLVLPFVGISVMMSTAALLGESRGNAYGYVFLCLLGAVSYAVVSTALPWLHAREASRSAGVSLSESVGNTIAGPLLVGLCTWALALPAVIRYPAYVAPYVL